MQEYDVSCTKHERSVSRTMAFEHGASPLCRRVAVINNCCVGIVCRCMAPCRLTRIVQERAKSCPSNRTTMGIAAHFSCRQRHPGRHHFGCMAPCRSMRIVRVRAKSCRIIGRLGVPSLGRQSIVAFACDRGAFLACERGAIFRTSVTLTIGHCSAFLASSAASGLTPFRMHDPMSVDADRLRKSEVLSV
jgi:hypothetical protein